MAILAKNVLENASIVLQDEDNVRWTLPELRRWFNDALREISAIKPTAFSASIIISLVVGTRQTIPAAYPTLLKITRNLKTTAESPRVGARAIRTVDMRIMDVSFIDWHDTSINAVSKYVSNVTFDPKEVGVFWVYPPNDGTGIVEATVSSIPTGIPVPASDPNLISSYDVTIGAPDIYANAIVDYILYRAFSKDSQYAGSVQKAAAYYQQFANILGVMVTNDVMRGPNAMPSTEQENAA